MRGLVYEHGRQHVGQFGFTKFRTEVIIRPVVRSPIPLPFSASSTRLWNERFSNRVRNAIVGRNAEG